MGAGGNRRPQTGKSEGGRSIKLKRTTFETSRAGEYFIYREERFEINAILPDTQRIEYIEEKLKENGVRGKVIPSEDALKERREKMFREKVDDWVEDIIAEILDTEELKKKMAEGFEKRFGLTGVREWIERGFEDDRSKSWGDVLKEKLEKLYEDGHKDDLRDAVGEYVRAEIERA